MSPPDDAAGAIPAAPPLLSPRRLEAIARLMELGAFNDDPLQSARGAATIALAHLAGVGIQYMVELRKGDWLPDGRQVVVIDPPDFFLNRRPALARTVWVPETVIWLVERYRGRDGRGRDPGGFLLQRGPRDGGGRMSDMPCRKALKKACDHLGITPAMTFGEARALYGSALEAADCGDGLYQYMAAAGRPGARNRRYTFETPPPDELMAEVVTRFMPLARPWRRLRSLAGPHWTAQ